MNYISYIEKRLKEIDLAYKEIKGVAARKRAGEMLSGWADRWVGNVKEPIVIPHGVVTETLHVGETVLPEAVEPAINDPEPVSPVQTPVVQETPVEAKESVKEVGGWPEEAQVKVLAMALNRRFVIGELGDGRRVTIENGNKPWKINAWVPCRLIRAGGSPTYRWMPPRI